jgi:hypothetical protein
MQYKIHTLAGLLHCMLVEQIGLTKIYSIANIGEVFRLPGRKIVKAADFIALRY